MGKASAGMTGLVRFRTCNNLTFNLGELFMARLEDWIYANPGKASILFLVLFSIVWSAICYRFEIGWELFDCLSMREVK